MPKYIEIIWNRKHYLLTIDYIDTPNIITGCYTKWEDKLPLPNIFGKSIEQIKLEFPSMQFLNEPENSLN